MIALLASLALAGPVEDAIRAELARTEELSLPDAPPLYHVRYQLLRMEQVDLHTHLGSLVRRSTLPMNGLGVEMRVGEPDFDNTGFGGWQDGFLRTSLAAEPTAESVRLDAWRLTDRAYKQAVEQLARKSAQFTRPPDYPGDYQLTGPTVHDGGHAEIGDADALEALAVELSGALVGGERTLVHGGAYVGHEAGSLWTIDTEGTDVVRPLQETSIRLAAQIRTDDGLLITDQRLWSVRAPTDLPPHEEMLAEATALRDQLQAVAEAPAFGEEYVGPVVFADTAAVDLMRYLLVPQLEGTPAEVPFDSWFGELGSQSGSVRLARRVLPPGWSAVDDPVGLPGHPGTFTHDYEGTPAEAVELITDGIVQDVLMCRVPRKGVDGTNGHARGYLGSRSSGRAVSLSVSSDRHQTRTALIRRGLKLARAYGRDHIVVIERLQEPALLELGTNFWYDEDDLPLPPPVWATKVYADGTEERLRGLRFAAADRWLLRDIIAAGPSVEATWLAPAFGGWGGLGPTEGLATRIRAAEVLVGEVELVPQSGDPMDTPIIPPPEP